MLNRNPKKAYCNKPEVLPTGDLWTYRIVVMTLSLTVLACIVGSIGLQVFEKKIPELLTALGTGAIGALAGILAPPPSKN
jgi:hypothetical protein